MYITNNSIKNMDEQCTLASYFIIFYNNIFFVMEVISNYRFCFFQILLFNTIGIHTLLVI